MVKDSVTFLSAPRPYTMLGTNQNWIIVINMVMSMEYDNNVDVKSRGADVLGKDAQ